MRVRGERVRGERVSVRVRGESEFAPNVELSTEQGDYRAEPPHTMRRVPRKREEGN